MVPNTTVSQPDIFYRDNFEKKPKKYHLVTVDRTESDIKHLLKPFDIDVPEEDEKNNTSSKSTRVSKVLKTQYKNHSYTYTYHIIS